MLKWMCAGAAIGAFIGGLSCSAFLTGALIGAGVVFGFYMLFGITVIVGLVKLFRDGV